MQACTHVNAFTRGRVSHGECFPICQLVKYVRMLETFSYCVHMYVFSVMLMNRFLSEDPRIHTSVGNMLSAEVQFMCVRS